MRGVKGGGHEGGGGGGGGGEGGGDESTENHSMWTLLTNSIQSLYVNPSVHQ